LFLGVLHVMSTGSTFSRPAGTTSPLHRAIQRRRQPEVNVAAAERIASGVAGGVLAAIGLSRFSLRGLGLALAGGALVYRGATGHCQLYSALGMNTAKGHNSRVGVKAQHGFKVEKTVTVNRNRDDVWSFWRNLENLPRIMTHLVSVRQSSDSVSHWIAKGPLGAMLEWDAELINEREGEMLAWRSLPGSEVDTAGSVHFESTFDGQGTVIRVSMKYDPPGGKAGHAIAALLGEDLAQELQDDLKRFKETLEAGDPAIEVREVFFATRQF